jgi:hypothetical protein
MLVAVPYASRAATADTLGGQTLTELLLTEPFQTSLKSALQEPALKAVLRAAGDPSITGTTDCLAKYDGSGNPTATSNLCEPGNRVGVGTATPTRFGSSSAGGVFIKTTSVAPGTVALPLSAPRVVNQPGRATRSG